MAGNELFFDPLQDGEVLPETTPLRAVSDPQVSGGPASQRSLELLRVRDELEKMARAGKRS